MVTARLGDGQACTESVDGLHCITEMDLRATNLEGWVAPPIKDILIRE